MKKVLVATVKPFHPLAVEGIKEICKQNNYEFTLLEKYADKSELVKAISDIDALIIRSDKVTEEILSTAQNLKIVVRAGAGYDNVDCKKAAEKNVVVMNTPGQNSNAVAELAFGMMLYMARGKFNGKSGIELKEKTIGIHAYGNVGQNVARIAKGFGMKVFAFDPFVSKEIIEADGVTVFNKVEDLYSQCDYISVHIPLLEATRNFVNDKYFSMMKEGACLVNTARKEVIDENSLLKIFNERKDIRYISDIAPDCRKELEENYPDRVFFTPKKMGAQTMEANINAGIAAIKQVINFFEKGDLTFKVN
jgi:D-3-phosphoglycerate dehydrogenase